MFRVLHHCAIPKDVLLDKCSCHLILIRPGYQETVDCIVSVLIGTMHKNSELRLQEALEMTQDYSCFALGLYDTMFNNSSRSRRQWTLQRIKCSVAI